MMKITLFTAIIMAVILTINKMMKKKKEGFQLNKNSIEFMKEVVNFADAKDSSGKNHL